MGSMKLCKGKWGCNKQKPLSSFNKDASKKDGFSTQCRECKKKYKDWRYYNYRDHVLEQNRLNAQKHGRIATGLPRKIRGKSEAISKRLRNQKYKHSKRNQIGIVPNDAIEILISLFGDMCMNPACELDMNEKNPLTLDHIIPISWGAEDTKLHDISNMQLLCFSCNSSKRNRTATDYRPFLYFYESE